MNKIILVTGGARSGKSTFAERLAIKLAPERRVYIATAQIFDDEMAHRIDIHKSRRDKTWVTIEAPFESETAIRKANKISDVILFDCLTIYVSNFLCQFDNLDNFDDLHSKFKLIISNLISAAKDVNGTIIFVTNEVGSGIVPENKLARVFRDFAGLANQAIAAEADDVYLLVSGIPVNIKNLTVK